jgi:hypothetical protein
LFGLAIPRGSKLYHECREYIEEFVLTFTLPLYFTLSGLKTDVATISSGAVGGLFFLVCFCATAGKFAGAGVSAYFSGCTIRESSVIAVLMNTRGLVELIVLNVGLQAGILNTRTFSVMVIMCLFTTFMTYPLISVIYPESMRMKADMTTSMKMKGEAEEEEGEAVLMKPEIDMDREISSTVAKRLGVVVVSRSQMQAVVDVLSYFLPHRIGSEFSVTAMHFIEPTKTKTDEFLGLNEEGRLIRVDEEATDISRAFETMDDPAAKKPQLLPISAYCNAYHIPVNAFRVEGDAAEFAKELKVLTMKNECNLLCIPFRPNSLFSMDFFWSSWRTVKVPLLLVMQTKPSSGRTGSGRQGTPRPPLVPPFSPLGQFIPRSTSGHVFLSPALPHIDEEGSTSDQSVPPPLYTNQSPEVLPIHRRRSVTRNIRKMMTGQLRTNSVVILLTGSHSDLIILSSILGRFIESYLNEITILLPKGYQVDFSFSLIESINAMRLQYEASSNLHWLDLNAASSDYTELYNECIQYDHDLFVCSFVEPNDRIAPHSNHQNQRHSDTTHHDSRRASGFFNVSLVDMFMYHAVEEDPIELRIESGMPIQYAYSSLPYPELGVIGSKMYENPHSKSSLVLIVHEPFRQQKTAKTKSLSAALPPNYPRSELRAVKSAGDVLHTYDEETKDSESTKAKAKFEMDSEV